MFNLGDNKTVTHVIVIRLFVSLKEAGHNIYMNNYYIRPSLFVDMKLNVLGVCSTACVDRKGMPLEWKSKAKCKGQTGQIRKELKKGIVRTKNLENGILALQWKYKRLITIVSTVHDSSMVMKTHRMKKKCREATNG